jgi:hypothetical protein
MKTLLAALLLLGCNAASGNAAQNEAAAPAGPGNLAAAGRYRDNAGPDVVVELELGRDGRFRFGIAAGSLGAQAEGRWTSDGRIVTLDTEPRPTPPAITAGPVTRSSEHPLSILVNGPGGEGIATIDVRVGMADGRVLEGYTQYYGWQPDEGEQVGTPRWVEISEEIHGIPMHRFQLDASAGNVFAFTLVPNDFGIADFNNSQAEITPEGGLNIPFRGDMLPMVREEEGDVR